MTALTLGFGLSFEDLYTQQGLEKLDGLFRAGLNTRHEDLHARLLELRGRATPPDALERAAFMDALGGPLQEFIGELFAITAAINAQADETAALDALYECKRSFVQRYAAKKIKADATADLDGTALAAAFEAEAGEPLTQLSFARHALAWHATEPGGSRDILAMEYAAWAAHTAAGWQRHRDDVVFNLIEKTDPENLVATATTTWQGVEALVAPSGEDLYCRDGFTLTDDGWDTIKALDHAQYCVICHERGRDSCAIGLKVKKSEEFQKSAGGVTLSGCPLEESISEMHLAYKTGRTLGALAIICVDNPLVAGTGHRICNDCMKACIFQKQEPVNIPQVETRILKDVLALPWGFEIYSLLTRWNPMNLDRPYPKPATGYKVLVVGLGPAGYTLAHHLLNDGHGVAAVDGLKIEPLAGSICGVDEQGLAVAFDPIEDIAALHEDLDSRLMAGFGGVAEYGITVRWDKNFLTVIRLLLERRRAFAMFGGVRFGSTITETDAFAMGFDHIALCVGAGRPNTLRMDNSLARGVRQASDFLMGLQLTGSAAADSVTNLQLRLPVVVIGGGLTAIDTATEALAYYVRQVEKFHDRYETLRALKGAEAARAAFTEEEAGIADDFIAHGAAIKAERAAAAAAGRAPDFNPLLESWGGATIAYRRRMADSPSYTLNHEEIIKAFEQGIRFAELLSPLGIELDDFEHARAIRLERMAMIDGRPKGTGEEVTVPARTVLIAAGTHPNTTLSREDPDFAETEGDWYKLYDAAGQPHDAEWSKKPKDLQILTNPKGTAGRMSFFGDLHPSFAGNVVSAMASARAGYRIIGDVMAGQAPSPATATDLFTTLNAGLRAVVKEVKRLTPNIVEVIIHAPLAARAFKPGQFFRLMNFDSHALRAHDTRLLMEGLALTGAWVDRDAGLVSVIVLEMGGSSNLCAYLQPGEPVVLMGPTGMPTETPTGETVLLLGGGLGNAVLFSIGQAMREAGSRVLYVGGYKKPEDRYHEDNILKAGDVILWACDVDPGFAATRPQDRSFVGNIVEAVTAYADGTLGEPEIPLSEVDRIIAIGSDRMMDAVRMARHRVLKPFLKGDHVALGSINSPMQCMMKEFCAQCLQRHVDPETGEEEVVYSCFNQDQGLDRVDFGCLRQRLTQNATQEKLTAQWIAHCLDGVTGV